MAAQGVVLWRIAKHTEQYRADDLSGGGSKFSGGRWNTRGTPVVYTSDTIALATLETLAHLGNTTALRNAFLIRVDVPPIVWAEREYVDASDYDPTWVAEPPGTTTIGFGDNWLHGASAPLLEVPSVIVPEENNVLVNPAHPLARKIRATVARQYIYDPRF